MSCCRLPCLGTPERSVLNVNVQLVRIGAAAPYFYAGRRGRNAALLERLALRAKANKLGLWDDARNALRPGSRGEHETVR
jgi:endonuclease YncB( thermonuclease family)